MPKHTRLKPFGQTPDPETKKQKVRHPLKTKNDKLKNPYKRTPPGKKIRDDE